MTLKFYRWLAVLILPVIASCYPKGANYTDELDLVYSNYLQTYDFKSKHTFAIPDSVVKITGQAFEDPDGNGKPEFSKPPYSTAILNGLKSNMAANGWQLVSKNSNPDIILLPSTMVTTNIYYYYDWWYWGWWYGGWWGWYYPCCYYPPVVSGYRSGSVFVQMLDGASLKPINDNATVVWNMIINGLAEGDATNIAARITTGINQAFTQSPYLKIN
jgi:uncharacterized protein DUF4136